MPKSNDLLEFRNLDNMSLIKKIMLAKVELNSLLFDKNLNKLKDTSVISKKKGAIAHMATVLRQKELVTSLEAKIEKLDVKKPVEKVEIEKPKQKTMKKVVTKKKGGAK